MFTIANMLTGCNLIFGTLSIVFTFSGRLELAVLAIICGAICDFLDGFTARTLKQYSPMGKELDSLADMVTFGVAPGMIVFVLLIISGAWDIVLAHGGTFDDLWQEGTMGGNVQYWIHTYLADIAKNNGTETAAIYSTSQLLVPFTAFLIPFFSLFRLAKFNIDKRQTTGFIGLPTPANSLFFAAFALLLWDGFGAGNWKTVWSMVFIQKGVMIPMILIFSFLLIAEIPLFSFKFQDFSWKNNKQRFLFLALSLLLLLVLWVWAIPVIIILYILVSLIIRKRTTKK